MVRPVGKKHEKRLSHVACEGGGGGGRCTRKTKMGPVEQLKRFNSTQGRSNKRFALLKSSSIREVHFLLVMGETFD